MVEVNSRIRVGLISGGLPNHFASQPPFIAFWGFRSEGICQ